MAPLFLVIGTLMDATGTTRRFARTERSAIEGLSVAAKDNGQGLQGREVDDSAC